MLRNVLLTAATLPAAALLMGCAYLDDRAADGLDILEASVSTGSGALVTAYVGMPVGVGYVEDARHYGVDGRYVGAWAEEFDEAIPPPLVGWLSHTGWVGDSWVPLLGILFPTSARCPPWDPADPYPSRNPGDLGWVGFLRLRRHRTVPPEGWSRDHDYIDLLGSFPIGIDVHVGVCGLRFVVNPLQVVDLLLGFFLLDLDSVLGPLPADQPPEPQARAP